jgi:hypothetical protein
VSKVYLIFSVVGWAWFAIVMVYLKWRMRREARQYRGFEVVRNDAK